MIRAFLRVVVLPTALLSAGAGVFSAAFATGDLVRAAAVSILAGGLAAAVIRWRHFPKLLTALPVAAALLAALTLAPPVVVRPTGVADAVATFLSVGLPAHGLSALLVVVPLVVMPLAVLTFVASAGHRPLLTLTGPVSVAGLAALLVAPHPSPVLPFAALVAAGAAVLVADTRSDLGAMPPLVGTRTEERRQRSVLRPVLQLGAAVAVLVLAASTVPLPGRADVRGLVDTETIRVEDPNPLSVAARWGLAEDPELVAHIDVTGDVSPGRFRLAVLDGYEPTGWHQSAAFAVTGSSLADDPVLPAVDPEVESAPAQLADVVVEPTAHLRPFRALPTAGPAVRVDRPDGLRFAPAAGVLLDTARPRAVRYTTAVRPPASTGQRTVVPDVPARLLDCPDSEGLSSVATQLTAGLVGFEERLDALEDWLLTRRIYDPTAPGGQTLASVDAFLATPFARGNLEVFVSTYALLARCAGVPVRIVVGFDEVAAGRDGVRQDEVTAWAEVPVDGEGWIVRDPLPTPAEQEELARLAQQPPPAEDDRDDESRDQNDEDTVPPLDPPRGGGFDGRLAAVPASGGLALAALAFVVPAWVMRRRRRIADPTAAVLAAWRAVLDALLDRGVPVAAAHTPQEVAQSVGGHVPIAARRAIELLVPLVDAARYRGSVAPESEASTAWALADLAILRMPRSFRTRVVTVRHPVIAARRIASVIGVARRRHPWQAVLPEAVAAVHDEAPDDIPGVSIDSRLGAGSTGTVYRGTLDDGTAVAVKVFRFGPGDEGFDQRRFEWEVQIAQEVSGLPHLPEVVGAGVSPVGSRPYLMTTLYEGGTLLDRVRRGGPLTVSEAIAVGADVASALTALHQLGVVHGDIKPENVFVAPDGWVLGDLGSAWLRAGPGAARSLTPPYAAPEVWRGGNPTPPADLYSLALTVVFAVTGAVPVAGNVPDAVEVHELFPDHPDLVRALDPDPRRRPRSADELARYLRPGHLVSAAFPEGGLSLPTPTVPPT